MEQKKKILSDSVWSVMGLVLMNVVLQFAVYPVWERVSGEAALGNILYLISFMNVFAVSMGVSVNYARLKRSADKGTSNSPYLIILFAATAVAVLFGLVISFVGGVEMNALERIVFCAVVCMTMWRYYADVEYKLLLNYRSYFFYFLSISVGYAIGMWLFCVTGLWPLTLLVGEVFGVAFVFARGRVLRPENGLDKSELSDVVKLVIVLLGSEMLSTLIFNADRIMLKMVIDEVAVTKYYIASLLGKTVALLTTPLTGVIIGYLSRYKGELNFKIMNIVAAVAAVFAALCTAVCTVGSYILIPILYPNQFESVRQYFIISNMAQVIFFVGSVVTVVLLRFAKSRYQMYITSAYVACFLAVCIPCSLKWGLAGFCAGLAVTTTVRFTVTLALGYFTAAVNKKKEIKGNDA